MQPELLYAEISMSYKSPCIRPGGRGKNSLMGALRRKEAAAAAAGRPGQNRANAFSPGKGHLIQWGRGKMLLSWLPDFHP